MSFAMSKPKLRYVGIVPVAGGPNQAPSRRVLLPGRIEHSAIILPAAHRLDGLRDRWLLEDAERTPIRVAWPQSWRYGHVWS